MGIKPQFFLTCTLHDLEYLTSLWLCSHPPGFVYLWCYHFLLSCVQTHRSQTGCFDVTFIQMITTVTTINVSVVWFWVYRKKSNTSIAVSLPERNQLETKCLLSPVNTCILLRTEQGQGDIMCIKLN